MFAAGLESVPDSAGVLKLAESLFDGAAVPQAIHISSLVNARRFIQETLIAPVVTTLFSAQPLFETKHFIRGVEAKDLSTDALLAVIKEAESEIEKLQAISTKTAHVATQIEELQAQLAEVVKVLDSK